MSLAVLHLRNYTDTSMRTVGNARVASHTTSRARIGIPSRRLSKSSSTLPSSRASSTSAAPVEVRQTAVRPGTSTILDFSNTIGEFPNQRFFSTGVRALPSLSPGLRISRYQTTSPRASVNSSSALCSGKTSARSETYPRTMQARRSSASSRSLRSIRIGRLEVSYSQ